MSTVKLYTSALLDIVILLMASIADLDVMIRIIAGCAGIVLACLTGIKFFHDIRQKRYDVRIKKLELERKEEDFRRYMEKKYK